MLLIPPHWGAWKAINRISQTQAGLPFPLPTAFLGTRDAGAAWLQRVGARYPQGDLSVREVGERENPGYPIHSPSPPPAQTVQNPLWCKDTDGSQAELSESRPFLGDGRTSASLFWPLGVGMPPQQHVNPSSKYLTGCCLGTRIKYPQFFVLEKKGES